MTASLPTVQIEALAALRNRTARLIASRMAPEVELVFLRLLNEVVVRTRIEGADLVDIVPPGWPTRLAESLVEAKRPFFQRAAASGWNMAREQMGLEKDDGLYGGVGVSDGFLTSPTEQQVEEYFARTSKLEAGKYANQTNSVFEEIKQRQMRSVHPETGQEIIDPAGLDVEQLARALEQTMTGFTRPYARLIARTGSNWAMNEGALQSYVDIGVTKIVWYTTLGDLTCPFCSSLHGKIVDVREPFVAAGGTVEGLAVDSAGSERVVSMTVPERIGNIGHPPLHPNCRCTIVPEVESTAASIQDLL